jgi:hypothetical protein
MMHMRIACWIPKATNSHSEYVILTAFPLQPWMQERSSLIHYTYNAFLFRINVLVWTDYLKTYFECSTVQRYEFCQLIGLLFIQWILFFNWNLCTVTNNSVFKLSDIILVTVSTTYFAYFINLIQKVEVLAGSVEGNSGGIMQVMRLSAAQ